MKRSSRALVSAAASGLLVITASACGSGEGNGNQEPPDPVSENVRSLDDPCKVMDLEPIEDFLGTTGEYPDGPNSVPIGGAITEAECWAMADMPEYETESGRTIEPLASTIHVLAKPYDNAEEASEGFQERLDLYVGTRTDPDGQDASYEISGPDEVSGDWDQGQVMTAVGEENQHGEFVYGLIQDEAFLIEVRIEYANDLGITQALNSPSFEGDPYDQREYDFTLEEFGDWVGTEYLPQQHQSVLEAVSELGEF